MLFMGRAHACMEATSVLKRCPHFAMVLLPLYESINRLLDVFLRFILNL